jgi:hypothetical protein
MLARVVTAIEDRLRIAFDVRKLMVGATGIEPVTPAV